MFSGKQDKPAQARNGLFCHLATWVHGTSVRCGLLLFIGAVVLWMLFCLTSMQHRYNLQVGDIASAQRFYVDALGFDQTFLMGSQALFVSAGGYHHHMAMNVWNSAGAGPRTSTLGMGVVDIVVPSVDEVAAADERLRTAGFATTHDGRTLSVLDPWRNEIRLAAG